MLPRCSRTGPEGAALRAGSQPQKDRWAGWATNVRFLG